MTVIVTPSQILQLSPNARTSYREAFQDGQPTLDACKISESPLRVVHFMAQVLHESAGLTIQFENLNYSADRLPQVWPSRFQPKGPLDPADYAHNPQKLANEMYGARMGNTEANDGYTYRGRGLLQITGKDSYAQATHMLRARDPTAPDFLAFPDEVIASAWCLGVAAGEWEAKGCNALADLDNISRITRAVNGGLIGLADRTEWAKRAKAVWPLPA